MNPRYPAIGAPPSNHACSMAVSPPMPPANTPSLTNRMNSLCDVLNECRETLARIDNCVCGCKPADKEMVAPPRDGSMAGELFAAEHHAGDLLARLRELAVAVGA